MWTRGHTSLALLFALTACESLGKRADSLPPRASSTAAPASSASPDSSAEVYVDCSGGFSVDFPRRASKLERERVDAEGVKGMMVSRKLADVELAVAWSQMPADVVKAKGAVRLLMDVRQGRTGDTEIVDQERISESMGAQMLEYTSHRAPNATANDAPAEGRTLLLLTRGGTLYQVQALGGTAGTANHPEVKAFVESFHLVRCK